MFGIFPLILVAIQQLKRGKFENMFFLSKDERHFRMNLRGIFEDLHFASFPLQNDFVYKIMAQTLSLRIDQTDRRPNLLHLDFSWSYHLSIFLHFPSSASKIFIFILQTLKYQIHLFKYQVDTIKYQINNPSNTEKYPQQIPCSYS